MEYRRHYQPGGCYFFTVVTQQRQPLLIDNIERLRAAFHHTMKRHPFTIEAIVILPDHLHTLWRLPDGDKDYSLRWMVLKRYFSTTLPSIATSPSQTSKREKGIWQRRFWEHTIRDESDWAGHMDYIHYNPVKHGYAESAAAWPYSSFSRWVEKGVYDSSWGTQEPSVLPKAIGEP